MTTTALEPIMLPAAQEEQVQALHDLLRKEGKARLIGRGGVARDRTGSKKGIAVLIQKRMPGWPAE